jgi:hypothetical protein
MKTIAAILILALSASALRMPRQVSFLKSAQDVDALLPSDLDGIPSPDVDA